MSNSKVEKDSVSHIVAPDESSKIDDLVRSGRYTSVVELLDSFHTYAAKKEWNSYFGCFASIHSRFLGTDVSENWTVREFYPFALKSPQGWTYTPVATSRIISEHKSDGEKKENENDDYDKDKREEEKVIIVYFDEQLHHDKLGKCRGTGCIEKIKVKNEKEVENKFYYFLIQYHLSIDVPNSLVPRFACMVSLI